MNDGDTIELLRNWHDGDRAALDALIARNLEWVGSFVRRRLGDRLRASAETQDIVQEAMIDVMKWGPRFAMSDEKQFRALLARIVENNLRDRDKWLRRHRRDAARERAPMRDSVLHLDPPAKSVTRPSQAAGQREEAEWVRLALELLAPADREIIWLREWEKMSYEAIADRLQLTGNAARMRFERALPRLALKVAELRQGAVAPALDD